MASRTEEQLYSEQEAFRRPRYTFPDLDGGEPEPGFGDEKRHNAASRPAPFSAFQSIRRQTSGGLSYAKYLCMQKEYRCLPDRVLSHAVIIRMHELVATLIGYHNDFIWLLKELARKWDVAKPRSHRPTRARTGLERGPLEGTRDPRLASCRACQVAT
ncbi:hypothetical protein HRG_004042 [Hirsutella rhossiliensis]|uniref:Uncharacterized protein n=1 Tax=Hirsutella rhossiliensis TaxID=111463 RepID=A0A9P8N502_9HYPO|nr:uncharacterized protein HRG_04042 [Hirsutella rhossiliensis]KAH0966026.1 hypothetical protein HRG_04042 [Hirsutella rhossiliensis]